MYRGFSYALSKIGPSVQLNPRTNVLFGNVPLGVVPSMEAHLERHLKRVQAIDRKVEMELLRFELSLLKHIPQPMIVYLLCRKNRHRVEGTFARFHVAWKRVRRVERRLNLSGTGVLFDHDWLAARLLKIKKIGTAIAIARLMEDRSPHRPWSHANTILDLLKRANMKPHELGLRMKDLAAAARKEREEWEK